MNFLPPRRVHRCLVVLVLAAAGCGPAKAKISGVVKYNGEPLPSGTITFLSDAGNKQVKGADIVDGKYTIPDFYAGPAKVTVTTQKPPGRGGTPPPGVAVIEPPAGSPAPAPPGKYVPIPRKYANPENSGLTYDIKAGEQTKDFDLTP